MDAKTATIEAARLVSAERAREQEVEGYTAEHDDQHTKGQLAMAAAAYALASTPNVGWASQWWPWNPHGFKPEDPLTSLVKAGALIQAAIERWLRAGDL